MKYYVYCYLREKATDGPTGTPYYVGKGTGNRAYKPHRVRRPKDVSNIIIVQDQMTEEDALALEQQLIAHYGRKDKKTGILRNRTNGNRKIKDK